MMAGGVAWALLTGLYVLLAGQASTSEIVAGLLAGLAAALLSVAVRWTGEPRFCFRGVPWPRVLGRPATALVSDTARVGAALTRAILLGPERVQGAVVQQPFARGDAEAAARRGLATLAISLTPNAYALRIMDHGDEMRLHRLAPRPPSGNRDWPL